MSTYGTQRTMTAAMRRYILERDVVCQLGYACCTGQAVEVDHVLGLAAVGAEVNDPDLLRGVCRPCHRQRSLQQQREGIAKSNARRAARRKLPSANAKHPGEW